MFNANHHATPSSSSKHHHGPGPRLMTAATLEGDKVVNLRNELLGTIQDITLDVRTGHIAHVLMTHGGPFGVADKLFVVPWSALTLDPVRKCFVMDMALEKMAQAPSLTQDQWPDQGVIDPQWVDELHRYFGAPPL